MKKISIILSLLLLVGCAAQEPLPPETGGTLPVQGEATIPQYPPAAVENPPPEAAQETPSAPDIPEEPPAPSPDPREEAVDALISRMTLAEKVGQLFFARCPASDEAAHIGEYHLGGLLLFLRDFKAAEGEWLTFEAFTAKVAAYQAASPIPLLIGVDEEGGSVVRASRNPHLFPKKFRSPRSLFAEGGIERIALDAFDKSMGLLDLGINVNFAPVADVSTDSGDFIHSRTLGLPAAETAVYVAAVVGEMESAGIGSVLKHFPGYGNNADTHTGIAVDERPYETFAESDFLPFLAGMEAGADSVLVSHNIVQCMDADLPASLSPEVHRILREELRFEGVILTDDLAMDAVAAYADDGSAAVLAILAGNDMVLTSDYMRDIPLVIAAVEDGTIPAETIDSALSRVLSWKYDLGLLQGE